VTNWKPQQEHVSLLQSGALSWCCAPCRATCVVESPAISEQAGQRGEATLIKASMHRSTEASTFRELTSGSRMTETILRFFFRLEQGSQKQRKQTQMCLPVARS